MCTAALTVDIEFWPRRFSDYTAHPPMVSRFPLLAHLLLYTPVEMGYAYGSLLYDEINTLVPEIFDYMEKAVEDDFSKLSPVLAKIVAEFGVPAALDFTWKQTSPFIKQVKYNIELFEISKFESKSRF
jgi:hypothetical protein